MQESVAKITDRPDMSSAVYCGRFYQDKQINCKVDILNFR